MEWTLDPVGGAWWTYSVAALLLAAPWVLPPRGEGLTPQRRRAIQLLRTAAVLVLLFAWLRPTVIRVRTETVRPTTVVLVDDSASMSVEDALGGASRYDATRRLLEASAGALERLAERHDLRGYRFAGQLTPLSIAEGRFALPESPTGESTALGAALGEALDASRAGDGVLRAVIVVSDGAQRARPPRDAAPLSVANRLAAEGVPLLAVAVGQRAAGDNADVAVDDLVVSDTAFAGAPLDVTAALRVTGYPNRSVRVRLLWENAGGVLDPVDAAQLTVRPGVEEYPVTLRHTPTAAGEWKLSVVADTMEGETLADNNEASTFVTVREGGVRVLYLAGATRVGGAPGVEQRFVRASLAASPDVVVRRVVVNYKPTRRDVTDLLAPGAVDVIVLDNVDADGISVASWRAIRSLVEGGAGLAMLGGRQSFGPGGHRATLGDVLPIVVGRAERQPLGAPVRDDVHLKTPVRMVPAAGRAGGHPIVRLESEEGAPSDEVWRALPPLDGANRLGRDLKPNAQVLATTDDPRAPEPLLVIGQPGLGRSLAMAGDSTWRWVMAGQDEAHRRFWRQAVLWLAKKDDDPDNKVYVDVGARRVAAGTRVDLTAGVRLADDDKAPDKSPTGAIRYEAIVTKPDGSTLDTPLPPGAMTTSGAFVDTAQAGDYRLTVRAWRGDEPLGEAQARFLVPRRDLELERPGAEPDTLARLAQATEADGGRTIALEELPTLLADLAEEPLDERREVVSRTTLWDTWPVLLLFAGLMTAEWLVRRGAGLP